MIYPRLVQVLPIFLIVMAHGLEYNISMVAQFFAEQAQWRNWVSALFHYNTEVVDQRLLSYIKVLSRHWILAQKAKPSQRSFVYKSGEIYFSSNSKQMSSSSLVFGTNEDLYRNYSSAINIASDLIFSYPGSCSKNSCETILLDQVHGLGTGKLRVRPLGVWAGLPPRFSMSPLENRKANKQTFIRVGIKNSTAIVVGDDDAPLSLSTLAEKEEEIHLIALLKVLFHAMNISYDMIEFPKLGWRNDEDTWTHLLGAIADGSVHIAADTVDLNTEGVRNHMTLTNPIIRTMSAIYMKTPDGVRLRDVVLGTFSPPLMLSVLLTAILLWIGMLIVTFTTASSAHPSWGKNDRQYETTEALMWTVSVLCMQGSPWSPHSLSGCILLIFSLMFALITYNSFAAFITSLLSVNDNPFRGVEDLLKTKIVFGYVQESAEEHFLRAVEEGPLRELYYRGLFSNGGVDDVAEGMVRASQNQFAFFGTARLARRTLHSQVSASWRCKILELPIPMTKTAAAIPMALSSPYNSLIHYWLIRIRETGILSRFRSLLLPAMPSCITRQQFHGASLSDLKTAFGALLIGFIFSPIVLVCELLWAKKHTVIKPSQRKVKKISRVVERWPQNEFCN